ncbi:MAG TPA: mechanosensitive ion channel domain-containing protein [Thermomicrobiales bacterium]|nr:mechanosensitive ion channel domain-containing protein [Thermomicrobiales bacterium]
MPDLIRANIENLIWIGIVALVGILAGVALRSVIRRSEGRNADLVLVVDRGQKAFIAVVVMATARIALLRLDEGDSPLVEIAERVTSIVFIATLVWLVIEVLLATEVVVLSRYAPLSQIGQVDVRKTRTQIILVRRLIVAVVITIGVAAALMTFPAVRVMEQGLLASAGLISIVAGLTAQSALTNVFAGIQLTLSNAMHVGDVVSVEGESGTIGEITLTYVVLYLWDDRRLILPTSHFVSNPYEN